MSDTLTDVDERFQRNGTIRYIAKPGQGTLTQRIPLEDKLYPRLFECLVRVRFFLIIRNSKCLIQPIIQSNKTPSLQNQKHIAKEFYCFGFNLLCFLKKMTLRL